MVKVFAFRLRKSILTSKYVLLHARLLQRNVIYTFEFAQNSYFPLLRPSESKRCECKVGSRFEGGNFETEVGHDASCTDGVASCVDACVV